MTREELARILSAHKAWLNDEPGCRLRCRRARFVDLSGFSSATVYRWLESGYLRGTKAGQKLWRIPRSELSRVAGWEGVPA